MSRTMVFVGCARNVFISLKNKYLQIFGGVLNAYDVYGLFVAKFKCIVTTENILDLQNQILRVISDIVSKED